jgi:NhaP-type Na+/H+ or K+/H+ antiporter
VYAVLNHTLVRKLPLAISLLGTGLAGPTVIFAGWFGPRGLASIVFGLLVAQETLPEGSVVLQAIFVTVALSVVLHGATAVWGANRYGRWYEGARASGRHLPESDDVGTTSIRRRLSFHGRLHRPKADGDDGQRDE